MWAAVAFAAAALAAGILFLTGPADAEAYQPIGLRVSESEIPEPPCPYGHDDACETAAPSLPLNAYLSSNPHDPLPNVSAGHHHHHHHADLASIAELKQRVSARLAHSGNARQATDSEPNGPGGNVSYAITSDITGLPWIRDGVTGSEAITGGWLGLLQDYNPSLVTSLVRMPFLQDHTPGDLQAIQTLTLISVDDPQDAMTLATLPGFADGGGIDNTEAKIVAVTSMPYFEGNYTLIELLADYGTIEESRAQGRYGNTVTFAIVRLITTRQNSKLMQSATSATRHAETLMAQALPVDFVGILVADSSSFTAATNGIHIQLDSGFDGDYYSDRTRQRFVAHEIGHYWWSTNNDHEAWISEGAAEYIAAYSVKTQFGNSSLFTDNYPCPYYRTIEHLRADNPHYGVSQGSLCNYSLGERLFINLDRNLGHAAFATGFRNLHQRLSTYEDDEIDQGLSLTQSFCPQCLASTARLGEAGHTLARRYGEKILTDNSAPTGAIAGLGSPSSVSLVNFYDDNRQYGIPEVSASSPDQRRWLRLHFSSVVNPPESVTIYVAEYHEEREPHVVWRQEQTVYRSQTGPAAWFYVYLDSPPRRAPGHHWVYVYNESRQKIAEAEYQVLP